MAYTYATMTPPLTVLGGTLRLVTVKVTPDAATGNVTIAEVTTVDRIVSAVYLLDTDLSANAATVQAAVDGSTVNKVNFKLWNAAGSAATAFPTFQLTVLAH